MIKDVSLNLTPEEAFDETTILKKASSQIGLSFKRVNGMKIARKSIDARRKDIKINLLVKLFINEEVKSLYEETSFPLLSSSSPIAIVVGSGPCGLFSALTLIENNIRPIVLERGKDVHERKKDCALLASKGILNENSNYSYGEGGAGAYSDGKLFTRSVKRGDVKKVLSLFIQHGADENIIYEAHPHIGTDKLPIVIENIRKRIIASGGEVHFNTRVDSLLTKGEKIIGVKTESGEEYLGPVIVATGHSAKDIYKEFERKNIHLESKDTAVGVRVEHPQSLIDEMQYHIKGERSIYLPPATYSFVTQVENRGVYSFCMCPGGSVVPSTTESGHQVVNGMSSSRRSGKFSNSAFVVQIREGDIPQKGVWSMLDWIESIERASYRELYRAPSQRMTDFLNRRVSSSLPLSTYAPGLLSEDLNSILPEIVSNSLSKGFLDFNRFSRGMFISNEALMIASETRTSSPIRVVRNDQFMAKEGLFVAGEGSGYAGGIVSAAIDGTEAAKALARKIWKS